MTLRLPLVAEQKALVGRIETAFIWIYRLSAEATTTPKLIDHLDQALLAKAFRDELVPQDPKDAGASILLDRIREDRGRNVQRKRSLPAA